MKLWAARFALLLCSILVSLALAEAAARRWLVSWNPTTPPQHDETNNREVSCSATHPALGWAPVPNTCERDEHGAYTSSSGAGQRVVVVGDSIAGQRRWVETAADSLDATTVHNLGVSGYHPCQSVGLLEERGMPLEPDLVVVQLCPNDLFDTPILGDLGDGRTRFYVEDKALDIPTPILRSRLLSYLWLRYGLANVAQQHSPSLDERAGQTRRCLQRLKTLDAPAVAVLFPLLSPEDGDDVQMLRSEQELRLMLAEIDLPTLDLRPVLEADGDITAWRPRHNDPIHPSKDAQRTRIGPAVGAFMAEQLSESDRRR